MGYPSGLWPWISPGSGLPVPGPVGATGIRALMHISAGVAAGLAALTQTFDEPGVDIVRSLTRFAEQVRLAVPSYLGVSVRMTVAAGQIDFDVLEDGAGLGAIRSSLMIPTSAALGGDASGDDSQQGIVLILYAGAAGALVDLAADLGWLTSFPLSDFALDQHLDGPERSTDAVEATSMINQALGALLGRGQTPEQAQEYIADRVAATGVSRQAAAEAILAELPAGRAE